MRSIVVLILVVALNGVAAIGFADSKRGQGNQGDNNDQGCSKKNNFCPDDGNTCTDNICDVANGECVIEFNTDECNDGNPCTIDDVCSGGSCRGTPITSGGVSGCSYPQQCCSGLCVSIYDPENCGSCGNACGAQDTCNGDNCVPPCTINGGECEINGDCCSGFCDVDTCNEPICQEGGKYCDYKGDCCSNMCKFYICAYGV